MAQQIYVTDDLGAWLGVDVEKKIGNDVSLSLEQQVRLYQNMSKFNDYLIDFGAKYKINKNFRLGANVRYTYNTTRISDAQNDYRYHLDLRYKVKLVKAITLTYRLRYQKEYINLFLEPDPSVRYRSAIRNKIKIKYKLNKTNAFYFSTEIHRLIRPYQISYYGRLRLFIGDVIQINQTELDCSLGYRRKFNTLFPSNFVFLKVIYKIEL